MSLLDGPIYGVCALVTAVSAAIRLHYTRKRRNQAVYQIAHRARMSAFAACFIGSLLAIPTVAEAIDRLMDLNEVSSLTSDLAAVIFWACLQVMIVDWTHSRSHVQAGVAVRIIAVCCVVAAMIWEFHVADTAHTELSATYARRSDVRLYLLTYLGFTAVAGLEIGAFSTGLAIAAWQQRRAAATGLSIAAAGGIFGVAHALSRSAYIIADRTGHAWPLSVENAVSPALAGLSIICVATGLALATIGYNISPKGAGSAV